MLGGRGGRVDGARSESGAAREQAVIGEGVEGFSQDLEARDDKRLLRVQKQLVKQDLLIVDELGYVPLSKTGAELLFEIFSQRYEALVHNPSVATRQL